jgi:hypothetical protein
MMQSNGHNNASNQLTHNYHKQPKVKNKLKPKPTKHIQKQLGKKLAQLRAAAPLAAVLHNPNTLSSPFRRWGHSCTAIPSSRCIVFGGYGSSHSISNKSQPDGRLNTVEIFDFKQLSWSAPNITSSEHPKPREHHSANYVRLAQAEYASNDQNNNQNNENNGINAPSDPSNTGDYLIVYGGRSNPHHGFHELWLLNLHDFAWRLVTPSYNSALSVHHFAEIQLGRWRHSSVILSGRYFLIYSGRIYNSITEQYEISNTALIIDLAAPIEQWQWQCVQLSCGVSENYKVRFSYQMIAVEAASTAQNVKGSVVFAGGFSESNELFSNPKDERFHQINLLGTENSACPYQLQFLEAQDDSQYSLHDFACECEAPNSSNNNVSCDCKPPALFSFQMLKLNSEEFLLFGGGSLNTEQHREAFNQIYYCSAKKKLWQKPIIRFNNSNEIKSNSTDNSEKNSRISTGNPNKCDEEKKCFSNLLAASMYMKSGSCVIHSNDNVQTVLICGGGGNVFHFNPYFNTTQIWSIEKNSSHTSSNVIITIQSLHEYKSNSSSHYTVQQTSQSTELSK